MNLRISGLFIYPVKSCGGISLQEAEVTPTGLARDREYMIVNEQGWFMTQRQYPRMTLIQPELTAEGIRLTAPGQPAIDVPRVQDGPTRTVHVWNSTPPATDQGDAVADWLSRFLRKRCRMGRLAGVRPVSESYRRDGTERVSFADSLPALLTSQASLDELNERLEEPVPMNRFRPNIVIAGGEPYQEDAWTSHTLQLGVVKLRAAKPCTGCEIITVDQATGVKDVEPMETLGNYRRQPKGIVFGQHLIPTGGGKIRVMDNVQVTNEP